MTDRRARPLVLDLGFHKVEKLETAGKRVVFQGLEGAYGHAAALQFFGKDADIHHVRRFEDMMVEIQEGKLILRCFRLKILPPVP